MAIKRRRVTLVHPIVATALSTGAKYCKVLAFDLTSSADTSVSLAVVDADSKTVATIASSDYTTKTRFYVTPEEASVFDTAGEVMAANGDASMGVVATGPLTLTVAGIDTTESLLVDVWIEV